MAINHTFALLFITLISAGTALPLQPVTGPNEDESLTERQNEFLGALSEKQLDLAIAYFADDAVLHVANMPPVEGREAIRSFYGNVYRFLSETHSTAKVTRVAGSSDMAYSAGTVTNVFAGEQGPIEYAGKFLLVWEKRDGEWLVTAYGISNNQADPRR